MHHVFPRATVTATASNGGDPVLDFSGANLKENDIIVFVGAVPSNTAGIQFSAGTQLDEQDSGGGRGCLAWLKCTSSPPSTITFTGDGVATSSVGALAYVFTWVDGTTPFDGVTLVFASGSSTNPDPGAATPNTDGAACLVIGWSFVNDTSVTAPTGYAGLASVAANADTNDVTLAAAFKQGLTSGVSENPGAFGGWSTGAWGMWTLILKPDSTKPEVVGTTSNSAINGGDVALGSSAIAGLAEDDAVLLLASTGLSSATGFPGDWTTIGTLSPGSGSKSWTAYKIMGATPDMSVTFTGSGNSADSAVVTAIAFRGLDLVDILDSVTPTTASAASGSPNPPSVTPNSDDGIVVACGHSRINDTAIAALDGYVSLINAAANDTSPTTNAMCFIGGRSASVAVDPPAYSSFSSGINGAWSIVLKAGSGGPSAYTINANPGSYAITGVAAGLKAGRKIAAEFGTYALTGLDAGLTHGLKIAADFGQYNVTGLDAALRAARRIAADTGGYDITGFAAGLRASRMLAAEFGEYAITGFDADLIGPPGAFTLSADPGTYAVTGFNAALTAARKIAAEYGEYFLTGFDAGLKAGFKVAADPGQYDITGEDAALRAARRLAAETGTYTLTGLPADLIVNDQPSGATPDTIYYGRHRGFR